MSMGEAIARAATPWAWRSRAGVLALVVACVLLSVLAIGLAWPRGPGKAAFQGAIAVVLLVVPAVRSVRRWDRLHADV